MALTFNNPSNWTINSKGTKSIVIQILGHEKTHYTIVLACFMDDEKLLLILIFKRKHYRKIKFLEVYYPRLR